MTDNKFSWPIIGHEKIGQLLTKAMDENRLPDVIGFAGPAHLGKQTAAKWIIKRSLCEHENNRPCGICDSCRQITQNIHPDVINIEPEKDNELITVDQIRSAINSLHLKSIGNIRWLMIAEAEKLNESARNALLKIVEEPPTRTRIIITTSNALSLPATLRSRVALYYWNRVSKKEMREAFSETSWEMIDIAAGRPGLMKSMPTDIWRERMIAAAKRVWNDRENRVKEEFELMMDEEEQALTILLHRTLQRSDGKSWFDGEGAIIKWSSIKNLVNKLNIYAQREKYLKANVSSQAIYTYVHNA